VQLVRIERGLARAAAQGFEALLRLRRHQFAKTMRAHGFARDNWRRQ
jgi:hypothetical protein